MKEKRAFMHWFSKAEEDQLISFENAEEHLKMIIDRYNNIKRMD
jgi:hypothetical protein